ncbi:hypothetical protein ACQ7B2_30165, partial [Escherichia coli]
VALVAVPIVLVKKNSDKTAPAASSATTADAAPVVAGDAQATASSSKLQTYTARDPFEPTSKPSSTSTS